MKYYLVYFNVFFAINKVIDKKMWIVGSKQSSEYYFFIHIQFCEYLAHPAFLLEITFLTKNCGS